MLRLLLGPCPANRSSAAVLEEGRGADGEVAGGEVEEFLHDVGVLLWGLRVCVGV